jgi:hypothetical protein
LPQVFNRLLKLRHQLKIAAMPYDKRKMVTHIYGAGIRVSMYRRRACLWGVYDKSNHNWNSGSGSGGDAAATGQNSTTATDREERAVKEHREQSLCVENNDLRRQLEEAGEALRVHRAVQSDAKWQPDLAALLRKYYGH